MPTRPLRRLTLLFAASMAAVLSCGREPTAPAGGGVRYARGLAFRPVFPEAVEQARAQTGGTVQLVPFTKVHVVLHHSDGSIALDTLVDFPPGTEQLTQSFTVSLLPGAPATGEPMLLDLAYVDSRGVTVYARSGVPIIATPAAPGQPAPPPVDVPLEYVGPGANATSVAITPRTASVFTGDAFTYTAVARDASGNVVPNTPIVWSSLDPAVATVASPLVGIATAQAVRGTAHIQAQLLTGPADQVTLAVQLRASAIAAQSGTGQTATVGQPLAQPLVAKVTASDGVAVSGVTVAFAVATGGGGVGAASAVTDAFGLAQTTWTLGSTVGTQTATASVAGLTGSPVTFSATGLAATATKLAVTTQPANTTAGAPVSVVVTARDALNNTATGFTGPVTLSFGANPGAATLGGATTVNAVAGVATFPALTVNRVGTGYTLVATGSGLTSATTNAFNIAVGPTFKVAFTQSPASTTAAAPLGSVQVSAQDSCGNVATTFVGVVTLALGANPGAGVLSGGLTAAAVAGVATFPGLSINRPGSGYTLAASATGLASGTSAAFDIALGPPAQLVLASGGGQSGSANAALPQPIVVQVADAGGNALPTSGRTVTFAVVTGGGTVAPTTTTTTAAGQASTTWTLGPTVGAQSISATSTGLGAAAISATATTPVGVPGVPTQLAFSVQPSNAAAGASIAPAITVQARDALGALAPSFTGSVTLAILANPGAATLGGTLTVAAVGGVATFSTISLNRSAAGYTLTASSGVLTAATSATFTISAGAASTIVADSGSGQSGVIGTALPQAFVARVTDAFGNAVVGNTVAWVVTAGGGSLGGVTTTTDAAGRVRATLTLGGAGPQSVTATATGVGTPVVFSANAAAAAVSKTWLTAGTTAWTTATNWSPAGVPAATDSVFIPAGGTQPSIASAVTVKHLYLAAGATLTNTNFLTVNGSLDAGTTITGGGNLVLAGTGGTFTGVVGATQVTSITGSYTLAGATTTGVLGVTGSLDLNGQSLTVNGSFSTSTGGTIAMTTGSPTLTVSGNATFNGGSEAGSLSAGLVLVGGNLGGGGAGGYNGSGTNLLRFTGATAQTVSGPFSGFQNVDFAGAGGVNFTYSGFNINGNVTIQATSGNVTGNVQAYLNQGSLTDASGGAKWRVDTLSFGGCACAVSLPAAVHGLLRSGGNVTLGASFTADSMEAYSGTITFGGRTVTVLGPFRTIGNGGISMTNAADALTVNGNASFNGGVSINTAGTTTFRGNFGAQSVSTGTPFRGAAGHTTVFNGTADQTITFSTPDLTIAAGGGGCGSACFGALTLNKATGKVQFLSSAKIQGAFTETTMNDSVSAFGRRLIVVGNFVPTTAPSHIGFLALNASNTGAVGLVVDTVVYTGTQAINILPTGDLTVLGSDTLRAAGVISGSVSVTSGRLVFVQRTNQINGNLTTSGTGTFTQVNDTVTVAVGGNVNLAGGSSAPAAGLLNVNGDFTATGASFDATGTHVLAMFSGVIGTPQTLTFSAPIAGRGINILRFQNQRDKVVSGNVIVVGGVLVDVTSTFVTGPGATVHVGGGLVDNTVLPYPSYLSGGWRVANTDFYANPAIVTSQGYIATNLTISGGTAVLDSAMYLYVTGDVTVTGASALLDIGGSYFDITGNFSTASGGRLRMVHPLGYDYMRVSGTATFAGGSTAGLLTRGFLEVDGGFTQTGTAGAFAADSTHETQLGRRTAALVQAMRAPSMHPRTRLRPTDTPRERVLARLAQRQMAKTGRVLRPGGIEIVPRSAFGALYGPATVNFGNPGEGAALSHFGTMTLGDSVVLATDVFAEGKLHAFCCAHFLSSATNRLVTTRGTDVSDLTFDNVRWLLKDGSPASWLSYTTFTNMSPAATQLEVQRSGNTGQMPTMYNMTFNTLPSAGGYYIKATDTDNDGSPPFLTIDLNAPTPPSASPTTYSLAQGALLTGWPVAFVFTGASGTWNTPGMWATGVVPPDSADVVIASGSTAILDSFRRVNHLTILGSGILQQNAIDLEVYGDLATDTLSGGIRCTTGITYQPDATYSSNLRGRLCRYHSGRPIAATGLITADSVFHIHDQFFVFGTHKVVAKEVWVGDPVAASTGSIVMIDYRDSLVVTDSILFRNSSAPSILTDGTLILNGDFRQTGATFAASAAHRTFIAGATLHALSFATPTTSFFQNLEFEAGSGTSLLTDVEVHGTLAFLGTTPGVNAGVVAPTGPARALTVSGVNVPGTLATLAFQNVSFKFVDGAAGSTFNNVSFSLYPLAFTGIMLEVNRSGGSYTFDNLNFSGTLGAAGRYARTSGGAPLFLTNPTPTAAGAPAACGCVTFKDNTSTGTVTWP